MFRHMQLVDHSMNCADRYCANQAINFRILTHRCFDFLNRGGAHGLLETSFGSNAVCLILQFGQSHNTKAAKKRVQHAKCS